MPSLLFPLSACGGGRTAGTAAGAAVPPGFPHGAEGQQGCGCDGCKNHNIPETHEGTSLRQAGQAADELDQRSEDPGQAALPDDHDERPFAAHFPADGGDGRHTGGVQQAEDQK